GVREELLTHVAGRTLGRGAVRGIHLDDDVAADVNVSDGRETQCSQCVGNCLALRVEEASAWHDVNGDAKTTHSFSSLGSGEDGGADGGGADTGGLFAGELDVCCGG